jgi:Secretion system C-terminal sorting domain
MRRNEIIFLLLVLLTPVYIFSQAPVQVRIMSYNTLSSDCEKDWNTRVSNFTPIVNAINPDIIIQIELYSSSDTTAFLNATNNAGVGTYFSGDYVSCGCNDENLAYYKSDEFTFLSNTSIPSGGNGTNNINLFKLKHNDSKDTILIFAVHLKYQDPTTRANQIDTLRNYIQNNLNSHDNFLVLGDFNIDGPREQAYQELFDQSNFGYVIDPINDPPSFSETNWSNNQNKYGNYLSVSSRYNTNLTCINAGGSFTRFDMILYSNNISSGSDYIQYQDSSFTVYGQDGQHYQHAITDDPPVTNAQHIFDASDHFPVYADFMFHDNPFPVQLTTFTGNFDGTNVILDWNTATELKNYGFNIERSADSLHWDKIGFVIGNGNSNIPHNYSFTDKNLTSSGYYYYRLKQIDNDGSYEYSKVIRVEVTSPGKFALEQNYPNPFNPSTTIEYSLPSPGKVSLNIFDVLGRQVETLVNEFQSGGRYKVNFNGSKLPSGIYFYRLIVSQLNSSNKIYFSKTKSLVLLK